jgi:glycine cleavage system H protein
MTHVVYSQDHEWIAVDEDGIATIGITQHAQQALGDIVFVELPAEGREVAANEAVAVVESVKAASDVYSPLAGTVVESNAAVVDEPGLINQDPEGAAWFFKLRLADTGALTGLLTREAYDAFLETLA